MRIEQMLTDALRDEAESRDVDVTGLWARTQKRLDREPARRGRRLPVLAAAAASLVVLAGALGLAQLRGSDQAGPAAPGNPPPVAGGVDEEFTCPEQITHDWTRPESVSDPYFVASLRGGPAHQASVHDAPRYELEEAGDRAFLRFGNADGSLATLSEFRLVDGEWTRFRTDVCIGDGGNIAVPSQDEWVLGVHEPEPYARVAGMGDPRAGQPMLVDDRAYYDTVGLVRHRSMYAQPCGPALCLHAGDPQSGSGTEVAPGLAPRDVTSLFMPPDEMVGRSHPYGLWVLYDTEGAVSSVSLDLEDGEIVWGTEYQAEAWPGTLHVLLAPHDDVGVITVHHAAGKGPRGGEGRNFLPEELPGYQAELHR